MSDVLKSFSDDAADHAQFLKDSGLKKTGADLSLIGIYNERGRYARAGFKKGHTGKNLLAYIGKEVAISEHHREITKIEELFEKLTGVTSAADELIALASYERK